MPVSTVKNPFLTPVLLALMVLGISPSGHTEDKGKAPWVGETLDGKKCIGKSMGFGPYDYLRRKQLTAELEVVETAHFTPEVERLEAGNTSFAINDIGYTITAWPNHHRALHSAMRYRMMYWEWPEDAQVPPAECQLQRAMQFSPQDPVPYMLYGLLLHKAQKYDAALTAFQGALRLRPDDVLTQYNMGLTLVELKQYKEAVEMAKSAYAAGIPLPGLKNKLIAAGQWPAATKTANAPNANPDVQLQPAAAPADKATQPATATADNAKQPAAATTDKAKQPATATTDNATQPAAATADKAAKTAKPKKANKELAAGDKQRVEPPVVTQ